MEAMLRLETSIVRWTRTIAALGFFGLLLVAMAITADVLLRKLANAPIRGLGDVQELVGVIALAASFPLVVAKRGSIAFRFLGTSLGKAPTLWLDALGAGLMLLYVSLIGWQLTLYTIDLLETGRTTWLLGLPVAPFWMLATGLVLLCIPVQVAAVVLDLARAVSGRLPAAQVEQLIGEAQL